MSQPSIEQVIRSLLGPAYFDHGTESIDAEYQEKFEDDGPEKAEAIAPILRKRADAFGFLSIGGATGSEAEHVLRETSINHAVLLEFSTKGCERARQRASNLPAGKSLTVVEGDAWAKLDEALIHLRALRDQGTLRGLVCSIQSLLHELPNRSSTGGAGFDLTVFFSKIFDGWDNLLYFGREPCAPDGESWPTVVHLRLREAEDQFVSSEALCAISKHVKSHLKLTGEVQQLTNGWVKLDRVIAVETLFKTIYFDGSARFRYEMQEQLTSIEPRRVHDALSMALGTVTGVRFERTASETFRRRYAELAEARSETMAQLPVPNVFARFFGERLKNSAATATPPVKLGAGVQPTSPQRPPTRSTNLLWLKDLQLKPSLHSALSYNPKEVFENLVFDVQQGSEVKVGFNFRPVPCFSVLHLMYFAYLKRAAEAGLSLRVVIFDLSLEVVNEADRRRVTQHTAKRVRSILQGTGAQVHLLSELLTERESTWLFREFFSLARLGDRSGAPDVDTTFAKTVDFLTTLVVESIVRYDILLCGAQDSRKHLSRIRWELAREKASANPLLLEFPTVGSPEPAIPERPSALPNEGDSLPTLEDKLTLLSPEQRYIAWVGVVGQVNPELRYDDTPSVVAAQLFETFARFSGEF